MTLLSPLTRKRVKGLLRDLPRLAAEHAFSTFLVFLVLGAVIADLLFYLTVWAPQGDDAVVTESQARFEDQEFTTLQNTLERRERETGDVTAPSRNIFFSSAEMQAAREELTEE